MKTKFEDPNKKPEQMQKIPQHLSEMKRASAAWAPRAVDPVKIAAQSANKKDELNEPPPPEAVFLSLMQSEKLPEPENVMGNFGTVLKTKTQKECKQEIKSSFEIEFKDLGKAGVQVVQLGDTYSITINMLDKSRIPKNPLLFKQLIEKQLGTQFGVNFKIQVT